LELANNSYNNVLNFYEARISKNQSSKNIYREQFFVMNFLAEQSELETKYNLPYVKLAESGLFNKSKLNIENQWASHPSTEDRVAKLRQLNIIKDVDSQPAKNLFKDFERTEEKLTAKLFANVKYEHGRTDLEFETFKTEFETQYQKDSFDKIFNNYYHNKNPDPEAQENHAAEDIQFETLFDNEKVELVYTLIALESDKKTIEQIRLNFVTLKSLEDQLKQEIRFYLQNPSLISEFSDKDVKDLKDYIDKEHIYFRNEEYFEANLQLLMNAINTLPYLLHRKYFLLKKDVLSLMKDLEENRERDMIS